MTPIVDSPKQPILIVEDNAEDYEATRRAFRKAKVANPLVHCVDGDDALDYLFRRKQYAGKPPAQRPGIILLDLNLPGTDGRSVLATIKQEEALCSIPVIVLTTSTDERDIDRCYTAGANSYLEKPVGLVNFFEAMRRLTDYWFEIVILPEASYLND